MEISLEAVALIIAGLGVLLAWLGYSANKRHKHEVQVVEQAKADLLQQGEVDATSESLKLVWISIRKVEEDMTQLVEKLGELDKVAALNNKDIAQLTREVDRLVEMHNQYIKLMSQLFKQQGITGT